MSCVTFPIAVLMRSLYNSGSVFGSGWDVNIVLDGTPQEEITLSGLVTGVARCRRCCLWPLHDKHIDLVYAFSARWQ